MCQKDAISCLNQCGAKIARLMMEDHMLTTCQKRLVQCHYCKRDFTGAVIDDHQVSNGLFTCNLYSPRNSFGVSINI